VRQTAASQRRRRLSPTVTALEGRALLSTLTVSNTDDSGPGSLRAAVAQTNSDGGGDTIVFSSLFTTPQTITLPSGQLELTGTSGTTIITGPGAKLLTVSGNNASRIFEVEGASAAISGLTITGGQADRGAGLLNQGGTVSVTGVTFSGNTASDQGGGVDTQFSGTTTLTACTISGNTTTNHAGGGLANLYSGSATLTNCTISGNSAPTGGGLYNNTGTLTLTNCTVSHNTAQSGGGLSSKSSSSTLLTNTLVDGNTGGDIHGALQSGSANNLIGGDPLLAPLGDYGGPTQTMALLPGSPAIGGGTATGAPSADQRGQPRSGRVDIGAFESGGFTLTPVAGSTPQSAPLGAGFANPLAVTITANDPAEPVDGGVIAFAAPPSGASATLSAATAIIAGGEAGVIATTASALGQYTVNAAAAGTNQTGFSLTNTQAYSLVVNTTEDLRLETDGENSLRAALGYADMLAGPQTITFDPAVFGTTPQTITLTLGELTLTDPDTVTIQGPWANLLTVNGGGKSRVFDVEGGSAAISGLTVSGGQAGSGGGLYNDGGSLTLTDCTVTDNSAQYGGGVANVNSGTTTLTDCTVSGNSVSITGGGLVCSSGTLALSDTTVSRNSAQAGGGLANLTTGTTTVAGGTFSGNSVSANLGGTRGGGLFNDGTLLSLTGVTVSGNTSGFYGGGVFNTTGTTALTDCTLSGNTAGGQGIGGNGAGLVAWYNGLLSLTDCTVSGNTADGFGGGLFTEATTVALSNCTVVGNTAGSAGGGLSGGFGGTSLSLTNCSVAGNRSGRIGGLYTGDRDTVKLINTIVAGNANGDLSGNGNYTGSTNNMIDGNPLLSALGDYGGPTSTMALLPGSPAIGGGVTGKGIPTTDQRGEPRTGHVDIGAFQSQGFSVAAAPGTTPQSTMAGAAFAEPLALRVTATNPVEPVDGGVVNFAVTPAPGGATATLSATTASIAQGEADVTATANFKLGQYTAAASVAGVGQANFSLTNAQDYGLVVNTTEDLPLETDGQNSLRAAIAYADTLTGPQTVTFDPTVFGKNPQTIVLTHGQLTLTNPATTTITGPGATLVTVSGGGQSRVFEIQGGPAALSGLTITGGKSDNGGGLFNDGGTLELTDDAITHNSASVTGGGLYNDGGTVTLTDCTVTGNSAQSGGGVANRNSGMTTLTDDAITGNSARVTGGGVISNSGALSLSGTTLSQNSANYGGGLASINNGTATLSDVTVSNNSAVYDGGGLFNDGKSLTLTGGTVSSNTAGRFGGGLNDTGGQFQGGTLTLSEATVTGNSARLGGGLYVAGTGVGLSLTYSTVSGNTATVAGGGVYFRSSGTATLTNVTVTGNSAATKGGALYLNGGGTAALTSATVTANSAGTGGGLYVNPGTTAALSDTIVADQTSGGDITGNYSGSNNLIGVNPMLSPLGDYGGATPTMALLPGSPARGGGASGTGIPTVDQRGLTRGPEPDIGAFQTQSAALAVNSTADGVGSALGHLTLRQAINLAGVLTGPVTFDAAVFGTPQVLTLTDGPIVLKDKAFTIYGPGSDLVSVSGGGASRVFEIDGVSATLSGLTITGGKADTGGGLYNNGGTLTLTDCTVTGNSAQLGGGVANMNSGTTTLTGDTVTENTASATGGGVLSNSGTLSLTGTTLSDNRAPNGGGLANLTTGTTTVSGGKVSGNSATRGGGLFSNGGSLSVTGGAIVSNNHGEYGAGLYNGHASLTLTNAIVTGNDNSAPNAQSGGAGVWNAGGHLQVTGGTISGNSAYIGHGGGVANQAGGTADLKGTTLSGNSASNGAAVANGSYFDDGTLTLTNVTISGNNANHGGGLYNFNGSMSLSDCIVSANGGGGGGGGFRVGGGNLVLTNTTVTGNTGYRGAGLECMRNGSVSLFFCSVIGNAAPQGGGGVYTYGASVSLTDTIIASNGGGDINVSPSGSNNLIGGNPLIAPLGNYGGATPTLALLPGSPAIGRGAPVPGVTTDQRGQPRNGRIDIGAFQSQGFTLAPVAGSTPQSSVVGMAFANPLAVTVTAVNPIEPVDGGVIHFTAPTSGASATLSAATAVIANGQASVTATAGAAPGTYKVNATAAAAATLDFVLTNSEAFGRGQPSPHDVVQQFGDLASLRAAIAFANSHPGPDTISFDPAVFGKRPRTIRVIGGPLVLTDPATTTIIGPGARRLTISRGRKGRVFDIRGGSLALSGVTITGGDAGQGGGGALRNDGGTLSLSHVTIRGNRARVGGALFNNGSAALTGVVIRGNIARVGSGVFNTRNATLTWRRLSSPASTSQILFDDFNPADGT
jgi:parallel beta-helix repeat protein